MKKNVKLIAAMMSLALLTPFMSACSGGTSSVEPAVPVERFIVNNPETFVVGDVINLDDYVTVIKADGTQEKNYDVEVKEVSQEVVSLNKHEVTVLKEGSISLTLSAGVDEGKRDAKFSADAISLVKAQFRDAVKDVTDTFGFAEYDPETEELAPMIIHNENYIWISGWDEDEDGETISGGIMKIANGNTHFFSMNAAMTEVNVDPGKKADFKLYYIAGDFALPYNALKTMKSINEYTGLEEEYLYIDYTDTTGALSDLMSYNIGLSWREPYMTQGVAIYPLFEDDGSISDFWEFDIYVSSKSAPDVTVEGGVMPLIFFADSEMCSVPALDDYIEKGYAPEALKYDELTTALDNIVNAKNYTMVEETSIYYTDPVTEKEVSVGDTQDGGGLINGAKEVIKVNENESYSVYNNGAKDTTTGAKVVGGQLYSYESDGATGYEGTAIPGATALWDVTNDYTVAKLGSSCTSTYAQFEVNSKETGKKSTIFEVRGVDAIAWTNALCDLSTQGKAMHAFFDKYEQQIVGTEYSSIYTFITTTVTIETSKLTIAIVLAGWDKDEATNEYTDLRVQYTFTNIGTTTWTPVEVTIPQA